MGDGYLKALKSREAILADYLAKNELQSGLPSLIGISDIRC